MSRIGKKPIKIPESVEVKINKQKVTVRGPKGELIRNVRPEIKVEIKDNNIVLVPKSSGKPGTRTSSVPGKNSRAFWGLERSLLQNMIIGVEKGFTKKLEIRGIGYKARTEDKKLVLELGFSHDINIAIPQDLDVSVEKNIIIISGIDKVKVGQFAATIKTKRKPDVYKGKGIRYLGEEIKLKPGKKAVTAG